MISFWINSPQNFQPKCYPYFLFHILACSFPLFVYIPKGSLLVESTPGKQLPGFQNIPYLVKNPRQGPSGFPHSIATGGPQNTLAQLQMQVEKLHPTVHWQAQPPWTLCQTARLPQSGPETLHGPALSHNMATQLRCRFMVPPLSHTSLPRGLPNPGFMPQVSGPFFLCVFIRVTGRPNKPRQQWALS